MESFRSWLESAFAAMDAAVRTGRDLREDGPWPVGMFGARGLVWAREGGAEVYVQVAPEEAVVKGRTSMCGIVDDGRGSSQSRGGGRSKLEVGDGWVYEVNT